MPSHKSFNRTDRISAQLRESHPEIGVVLLSQFAEPRYSLALLEQGSDGRAYLLKERIQYRGQLVSAIESVAEGGSVMDAKLVEGLVETRRRAERSPLNDLTPRELEILTFIARGHSNQAIADCLAVDTRDLTSQGVSTQGSPWLSGSTSCVVGHGNTPNTRSCMFPPGRILNMASSAHPGGVNLLLCDGSVKFVKDTVSRPIWRALGTRASPSRSGASSSRRRRTAGSPSAGQLRHAGSPLAPASEVRSTTL